MKIFLSNLDKEVYQNYLLEKDPRVFLHVAIVKIICEGNELEAGDAIMITEKDKTEWKASENSSILLFDAAMIF